MRGLPESLVFVRLGGALQSADEFYLQSDGTVSRTSRGAYGVVVAIADGFVADYDASTDAYRIYRQFAEPKRISLELVVDNERDEQYVETIASRFLGWLRAA